MADLPLNPFRDGMPRISPEEATRYSDYLSEWRSLNEVAAVIVKIEQTYGFNAVAQGELKFWRESFVGLSCAILTHAVKFRLGEDPPDVKLDFGRWKQGFEVVSVMPQDWTISQEYKSYAEELNRTKTFTFKRDTYEDLKRQSETLIEDAALQVEKKVKKGYPEKYILIADIMHDLVLNQDFGHARELNRIGRSALKAFEEVWFRKGHSILRVSPAGTSIIERPWPADM